MTMTATDMELEYRVTFGQRWCREQHPTVPEANCDGWVTVVAPDYETARDVAMAALGEEWAFIYTPDDTRSGGFWEQLYPAGELARFDLDGRVRPE